MGLILKGTEDEKFSFAFNSLYPDWDCRDIIQHTEQSEVKAFLKGYNQAIEDSRASEMLSMLQKISTALEDLWYEDDSNYIFDIVDAEELDNLIKHVRKVTKQP